VELRELSVKENFEGVKAGEAISRESLLLIMPFYFRVMIFNVCNTNLYQRTIASI